MVAIRKTTRYGMNSFSYYAKLFRMSMFSKVTLRKILSISHALLEWKTKQSLLRSRPFIFRIEPSAICNLRCPGCTTPKRKFTIGQVKLMSLPSFQYIWDKISRYAHRVTFYMEGEPMMNPNLFNMIRLAGEKNKYTSFSTNFTHMKPELLKPLFDSKLDLISISLDGYTQATYERYRINGDVMKVRDGIKMLISYKKEHALSYPFVRVYTIMFRHVESEMAIIKSFCEETGVDELHFRPDESNSDGSYLYKCLSE
jgi:MoaA/NifB/PqqE/SkfB family radical SAM enzyme